MTVNHAWMIKGWLLGEANVPEEIMAAVNTVIASFKQPIVERLHQPKEVAETTPDVQDTYSPRPIYRHTAESAPEAIETVAEPTKKPKNPDNVWNDWQINKLIEMKEPGATASDIAEAVGKTATQVHNKWAQHKAKMNKGSTSPGEARAPSMGGA
jgi:hypothetical protein